MEAIEQEPARIAGSAQDLIAKSKAGKTRVVDVPEWGSAVEIRELTRGEIREIANQEMSADESEAYVWSLAVINPTFTVEEATALLTDASFKSPDVVLNAIMELAGMAPGFREGDEDRPGAPDAP